MCEDIKKIGNYDTTTMVRDFYGVLFVLLTAYFEVEFNLIFDYSHQFLLILA